MKLTTIEVTTMLAALRHWQNALEIHGDESGVGMFFEQFDQFDNVRALTTPEIDALCEKINFSS